MKLLLENWREFLNEYSRPWSDPSKVKIVSDVLYYYPEGGRLFLVAEFERFAGGPLMKFGFYSTRGESVLGTEGTAFTWLPATGIKEGSGWIMKIPGKYSHPQSLLGMVIQQLNKEIPNAVQQNFRREAKRQFIDTTMGPRGNRFSGEEEEQRREDEINKQISDINGLFRAHGVYDLNPEDVDGMQINETPT